MSNIITDHMKSGSEESHVVSAAVTALNNLVSASSLKTSEEYMEQLSLIKIECDKGLQYRVLAGKNICFSI